MLYVSFKINKNNFPLIENGFVLFYLLESCLIPFFTTYKLHMMNINANVMHDAETRKKLWKWKMMMMMMIKQQKIWWQTDATDYVLNIRKVYLVGRTIPEKNTREIIFPYQKGTRNPS